MVGCSVGAEGDAAAVIAVMLQPGTDANCLAD